MALFGSVTLGQSALLVAPPRATAAARQRRLVARLRAKRKAQERAAAPPDCDPTQPVGRRGCPSPAARWAAAALGRPPHFALAAEWAGQPGFDVRALAPYARRGGLEDIALRLLERTPRLSGAGLGGRGGVWNP